MEEMKEEALHRLEMLEKIYSINPNIRSYF